MVRALGCGPARVSASCVQRRSQPGYQRPRRPRPKTRTHSRASPRVSFAAPFGLLALLAIPVVLFLHKFRRRFARRRVAGLFLYAPDAIVAHGGRKRTRLLRTASLWLELAAALVLAALLSGLSLGATETQRHLICVVDASASMAAQVGGESVAARVRARIGELVRRDDVDLVSVILTAPRPEILVGPRARPAEARSALAAWVPRLPHHDPGPAWTLAQELAAPGDQLVFLTDHRVVVPPRFAVEALGRAVDNVAIAGARRVRFGTTDRVFVDLVLRGAAARVVSVTLRVGDAPAASATKELRLTPGRPGHVEFRTPATDLPLRLALPADALAIDNRATLLRDALRVVRVANLLPKTMSDPLRMADALAATPGLRLVRDPATADLVFATGPGRLDANRVEVILGPTTAKTDAWLGPFVVERRHPLLDGMTLDGVIWSSGRGELPGLPLVSAGARVLCSEERVAGGTRFRLDLAPARTNFASSPDWPIFVANVAALARRRLPGQLARNVRLGESMQYRVAHPEALDLAKVALVRPDGSRQAAHGRRVLSFVAGMPGLYRLELPEGEAADDVRFSVSFVDAQESDLTGAVAATIPASATASIDDADARPANGRLEARLLALLLLLVIALDWWVLGRGGR